jgi:prepilin-type N-terminal cleavage/methylation domain-containing protein
MNKKGFTLIELLIVIGVLGILAAGLLAAVDPFEQLKKARDANNRNASIETLNAFTRYYSSHAAFPWNRTAPTAGCVIGGVGPLPVGFGTTALALNVTGMQACINESLIVDGELKTEYFTGLGDSTGLMVVSSGPTSISVCFPPEGKAARADSLTKYYVINDLMTVEDRNPALCPGAQDGTCYQCYQ